MITNINKTTVIFIESKNGFIGFINNKKPKFGQIITNVDQFLNYKFDVTMESLKFWIDQYNISGTNCSNIELSELVDETELDICLAKVLIILVPNKNRIKKILNYMYTECANLISNKNMTDINMYVYNQVIEILKNENVNYISDVEIKETEEEYKENFNFIHSWI